MKKYFLAGLYDLQLELRNIHIDTGSWNNELIDCIFNDYLDELNAYLKRSAGRANRLRLLNAPQQVVDKEMEFFKKRYDTLLKLKKQKLFLKQLLNHYAVFLKAYEDLCNFSEISLETKKSVYKLLVVDKRLVSSYVNYLYRTYSKN